MSAHYHGDDWERGPDAATWPPRRPWSNPAEFEAWLIEVVRKARSARFTERLDRMRGGRARETDGWG